MLRWTLMLGDVKIPRSTLVPCRKQQLPRKKDLPAFGDPPHIFAGKHKGHESCTEVEVPALPQLLLLQIKAAAHKSRSLHPSSPCELTDISLQTSLSAMPKQCKQQSTSHSDIAGACHQPDTKPALCVPPGMRSRSTPACPKGPQPAWAPQRHVIAKGQPANGKLLF